MKEIMYIALLMSSYVAWPVLMLITLELAYIHSRTFRRFMRWLGQVVCK